MQELATVLGQVVTGLFALLAAFFAWRLKRNGDEKALEATLAVERHRELTTLYSEVFSNLEQAMKCALHQEPFELTAEHSRTNAKVRLLGSKEVNLAYDEASDRLRKWSELHFAASPRRTRIGDRDYMTFQAPDPTAKFKVPAQEAHKALHESLTVLREHMRADLGRT